ncbi:MAG: hypothetical protein ABSE16_11285 [Verrucomicrobiota bacterium]|jgi:hypothetical protein
MEATTKPVSKSRVVLTWLVMIWMILVITVFFFVICDRHAFSHPPAEEPGRPPSTVLHVVVLLLTGGFFLAVGLVPYLAAVFTGGFTFDYSHPVWNAVKTKQYILTICVIVGVGLGSGFILAAFLLPILTALGLDSRMATMLPLIAAFVGIQVLQMWVQIWAPLERRTILNRLAARGITPAQIQGATLVGLSDPASGLTKRVGAIEEDMGALWVTPDYLMFRGDVEQLDISRSQIAQIERKVDSRSTTALAGIAHVILHVRLPDNSIRRIRLHVEGLWTLGRKKRAMEVLANAIAEWQAA